MTTEETVDKTVKVWDISDPDDVQLVGGWLGSSRLAHNVHIQGRYAFVSHYSNGLIVPTCRTSPRRARWPASTRTPRRRRGLLRQLGRHAPHGRRLTSTPRTWRARRPCSGGAGADGALMDRASTSALSAHAHRVTAPWPTLRSSATRYRRRRRSWSDCSQLSRPNSRRRSMGSDASAVSVRAPDCPDLPRPHDRTASPAPGYAAELGTLSDPSGRRPRRRRYRRRAVSASVDRPRRRDARWSWTSVIPPRPERREA